MDKMGKRPLIILGVMAIVILFAAFYYLAPKKKIPGVDMTQKAAELKTFVTGLTAGMEKESSKNPGALIFSRAEREWTQDPFLDSRAYKSWTQVKVTAKEAAATATKIEFVYSGYLEVERKRMAIINGIDYREGDGLETKGYVLKSVSPSSVVIQNRGTGVTLNVPLLE